MHIISSKILIFGILVAIGLSALPGKTQAPLIQAKPDSIYIHNRWLRDDYSWLEDRNNKDLLKLLSREAKYAAQEMKSSKSLAKKLYKEFSGRINETEISQPYYGSLS